MRSLWGFFTTKPRAKRAPAARLTFDCLEGRDVPSVFGIASTTPSALYTGGAVPSWSTTTGSTTTVDSVLKITFDSTHSPSTASAGNKANYGLIDVTTGSTMGLASVSYSSSSKTATITLNTPLPVGSDTYQLTVRDSVVDSNGNKLDGNGDGKAGGNFTRSFTVAPKSFALLGFPNSATVGQSGSFTLTALDAAGALATGYRGTVHFTSNDSKAILPADYTFTAADNGTHIFTATMNNKGTKSLTATDVASSSITGKQANITVVAATSPPVGLDPTKPPSGNFNLTTWNLTLPIGPDEDPTVIPTQTLVGPYTLAPYFTTGADGAMVFWAPVTGSTTEGSSYARSELRETDTNGQLYNWSVGDGTSTLSATVAVYQVPSTGKVVIGQIHSKSAGQPLVKLMYQYDSVAKTGQIVAQLRATPTSDTNSYVVATGVPLNTQFSYQIQVKADGSFDVLINGVSKLPLKLDSSWNSQTLYFKAGSYVQDNSGNSSEGAKVSFYALTASHA